MLLTEHSPREGWESGYRRGVPSLQVDRVAHLTLISCAKTPHDPYRQKSTPKEEDGGGFGNGCRRSVGAVRSIRPVGFISGLPGGEYIVRPTAEHSQGFPVCQKIGGNQ